MAAKRGRTKGEADEHRAKLGDADADGEFGPVLGSLVACYKTTVLHRKRAKGYQDGWYAILWKLQGSFGSGSPALNVKERGPYATEAQAREKADTLQLFS